MAKARTKANILFLDACRDVPTGTKGGTKGLGQVRRRPPSTLILYSTGEDETAKDDRLFNRVVLNKIALNQPFISVANDISYTVKQQTAGEQVPELIVNGLPNIILARGDSSSTPQQNHSMRGITTVDGLMYQNQPFSAQDKRNYDKNKEGGRVWSWKGAKRYCQNLTLGGYSDWRLPTEEELKKLLTENRNINRRGDKYYIKKEFIENMPPLNGRYKSAYFWSSTERDSFLSWGVLFTYGNSDRVSKSYKGYVLCVR